MIKSWSLENFKSIRDHLDLEFAPLTLFAGENSAGKSSLIQSILLTAQTLQSGVFSKGVILNGRIARLGTFSDIHANRAKTPSISISFHLTNPEYGNEGPEAAMRLRRYYFSTDYYANLQSIRCQYSFSAGSSGAKQETLQLQPQLEEGCVGYVSSQSGGSVELGYKRHNQSISSVIEQLGLAAEAVDPAGLAPLEFSVTGFPKESNRLRGYPRGPRTSTPAGIVLKHFLPAALAVSYDRIAEDVDNIFDGMRDPDSYFDVRSGPGGTSITLEERPNVASKYYECVDRVIASIERPSPFASDRVVSQVERLKREPFSLQTIHQFLTSVPASVRKAVAADVTKEEEEFKELIRQNLAVKKELTTVPPPEAVVFSSEYLSSFFSERVRYLGPLRDEPKSVYPLSGGNDPNDVGFRGEHTAAVLEAHRNSLITYIPSRNFPFSTIDRLTSRQSTLGAAVRDWLGYLGIGSEVETNDKGKLGHELKIATSKESQLHDLTHVGVGVSQALPILVLSLLAERGSTLIFEQPELHLHPRVQTRLADFFVSMIFSGKQCIVESHSEYLVSRLRYLTASSKGTPMAKNIKLYFVKKNGDQSEFTDVVMTEKGVIPDWPEGFFDESERNSSSIVEAQIEKSRLSAFSRKNFGSPE